MFTFAMFCPDWLKICHDGRQEHPDSGASGRQGANEGTEDKRESGYMESIRKRDPPPLGKRPAPSTPIIFRTKNTEKSHLGLIGKNFGKNLWENVSGERKAPNLVERGRGAKIRKIRAKIVELFSIAR